MQQLFGSLPSQAFIMAFTSDMIPRMVFLYSYDEHKSMRGYVNNSLSVYNISHIPERNMPEERDDWFGNSTTTCRYCLWIQLILMGFFCRSCKAAIIIHIHILTV